MPLLIKCFFSLYRYAFIQITCVLISIGLAESDGSEIKPYLGRYKNWGERPCRGKFAHAICITSVGDLPQVWASNKLVLNKLHLDFHPFALNCLEEMIFNRTRDEYLGTMSFDPRWYGQLGFVNNKV